MDTFQPGAATTIHVESANQSSPSVYVKSAKLAPALFTRDSSGFGQALAFNSDGSPNGPGTPAPKGTIIDVVANGLGISETDNSVQLYFFTGSGAVSTEIRTAAPPGLPGDSYSILRTTVPANVIPSAGSIEIGLRVNGVIPDYEYRLTIWIQ